MIHISYSLSLLEDQVYCCFIDINMCGLFLQCNFRTGTDGVVTQTGACPEATSNVTAVSAHVEGCTTCFKFNRPVRAST